MCLFHQLEQHFYYLVYSKIIFDTFVDPHLLSLLSVHILFSLTH